MLENEKVYIKLDEETDNCGLKSDDELESITLRFRDDKNLVNVESIIKKIKNKAQKNNNVITFEEVDESLPSFINDEFTMEFLVKFYEELKKSNISVVDASDLDKCKELIESEDLNEEDSKENEEDLDSIIRKEVETLEMIIFKK